MSLLVSGVVGRSHNPDYIGAHEITGAVYEDGVPGAYECVLSTKRERQILQRTVSAEDGSYAFRCLREKDPDNRIDYYVTFFDHGAAPARPWVADVLTMTEMALSF